MLIRYWVTVSNDKSIKVEDWLLLTESLDRSLIDISKESCIPYITLKVKRKRLKDKIRNNVNIWINRLYSLAFSLLPKAIDSVVKLLLAHYKIWYNKDITYFTRWTSIPLY